MSFRFHLLLSLLRFSEDFLLKWCAVRDADVLLDLPSDSALLCLFPDFSVMFSNLVEGGEKKIRAVKTELKWMSDGHTDRNVRVESVTSYPNPNKCT